MAHDRLALLLRKTKLARPEGIEPPAYRFEGNQKGKPIAADPGKPGSAFTWDGSPLCNEAPFLGIRCTSVAHSSQPVAAETDLPCCKSPSVHAALMCFEACSGFNCV